MQGLVGEPFLVPSESATGPCSIQQEGDVKSWRTTLSGVVACIMAVISVITPLIDDNAATNPDFTAAIAAFVAGIGLITARDNKVSSEQAGAGNTGPNQ